MRATTARTRYLTLLALVISGEMIFALPFHVPRYFRPTVLEAFSLSNADLGDVFAVYGVTAMLAYFPGGMLADRFAARSLMCGSLLATAAGGLYLLTLPGPGGLAVLYGYWGLTTILLFWAAMIRATREWGGSARQGQAFGLLDGGRGLAAAAFASLAVALFAMHMPAAGVAVDDPVRNGALRQVIALYIAVTALAAAGVRFGLPSAAAPPSTPVHRGAFEMPAINPAVWLIAIVVVCAYCGYKGLDNTALYLNEVLDRSETEAAAFTAGAAWLRPVGAIAAGLLADRYRASATISVLFAVLAIVYGALAWAAPDTTGAWLITANLGISFAAVFALRGVYFALLEEARVPRSGTGLAVGIVSVIGYTPDIFFAPVAGRILDAAPGLAGHQHYFLLLTAIAGAGLLASLALSAMISARRSARTPGELKP